MRTYATRKSPSLRSLANSSEVNQTTHKTELGAVVFVSRMLRHYPYGAKYTIFIYHKSRQHIRKQKEIQRKPTEMGRTVE